MLSEHQCCKFMLDLLSNNSKLRQIPASFRDSPNSLAKLHFTRKIFGVWKKDALAVIKNKEDQIFLEAMKFDGAASFEGVTKRTLIKIEKMQNGSKKKPKQERHKTITEQQVKSHVWSDNSASSRQLGRK